MTHSENPDRQKLNEGDEITFSEKLDKRKLNREEEVSHSESSNNDAWFCSWEDSFQYLCTSDEGREESFSTHESSREGVREENECSSQPKAGSSTLRMKDITSSKIGEDGRVKTGWVPSASKTVSVRGQKYLLDKKKIPSPSSLYELIELDVFHSKKYITNIGEKVIIPNQDSLEGLHSECNFCAPQFLVISFVLPTKTPRLLRESKEGQEEGYIVTGYYRMRDETRKILKTISNPDYDPSRHNDRLYQEIGAKNFRKLNAVRLWERWCEEAPNDPETQKRLKFIPKGDNLKDLGIPDWICRYNGKPMLIKRPGETSFLYKYPGRSMMEIGINLHPLPYAFKQAMAYLRNNHFQNMIMTFSFIIEGRDEEELPEVLIGDPFILPCIEHHTLKTADEFFSQRG